MAMRWDEAFNTGFQNAQELAFKKWQTEQDNTVKQQQIEAMKGIYGMMPDGNIGMIGSIPKGSQFVTPTTLESPTAKGARMVDTQVKKDVMGRLAKLQELLPVLDQFDTALKSTPVGTGFQGKMAGIGTKIKGMSGVDPMSATIQANANSMLPQIARGFGDVGNLSEQEQRRAGQFVPQLTDPDDTRAVKALSGYLFIKNKITGSVKRAGLDKDPAYATSLSELNKRISNKFMEAINLGVSVDKLEKFSGTTLPKYKTEKEAEKANPDSGSIIIVNGRPAIWE